MLVTTRFREKQRSFFKDVRFFFVCGFDTIREIACDHDWYTNGSEDGCVIRKCDKCEREEISGKTCHSWMGHYSDKERRNLERIYGKREMID